jgi:hypothetical protein
MKTMPGGIEALSRILAPPEAPPSDLFDVDDASRRLGSQLPDDYLEFVRRYGDGTIDSFLIVLPPTSQNKNVDLVSQCERVANVLETVRKQSPAVRYAGYPSPGGLIPWGKTENGDLCFWKTGDPDPNRWTVVVSDGRMWDWEEYPGSMTAFLADVLGGKFHTRIFPDDFPSDTPTFARE